MRGMASSSSFEFGLYLKTFKKIVNYDSLGKKLNSGSVQNIICFAGLLVAGRGEERDLGDGCRAWEVMVASLILYSIVLQTGIGSIDRTIRVQCVASITR
jgi:hypothetical protein